MFWLRNKKIIFWYTLLTKGLKKLTYGTDQSECAVQAGLLFCCSHVHGVATKSGFITRPSEYQSLLESQFGLATMSC